MRRRGRAEGRERAPGSEPGGPSRARPPTVTRSGTLKVDRGITPPRSESCGGGLTRLRIETLLVVLISRRTPWASGGSTGVSKTMRCASASLRLEAATFAAPTYADDWVLPRTVHCIPPSPRCSLAYLHLYIYPTQLHNHHHPMHHHTTPPSMAPTIPSPISTATSTVTTTNTAATTTLFGSTEQEMEVDLVVYREPSMAVLTPSSAGLVGSDSSAVPYLHGAGVLEPPLEEEATREVSQSKTNSGTLSSSSSTCSVIPRHPSAGPRCVADAPAGTPLDLGNAKNPPHPHRLPLSPLCHPPPLHISTSSAQHNGAGRKSAPASP
ncbi:unnamed protein product [Gadus morhua 'NCC']